MINWKSFYLGCINQTFLFLEMYFALKMQLVERKGSVKFLVSTKCTAKKVIKCCKTFFKYQIDYSHLLRESNQNLEAE